MAPPSLFTPERAVEVLCRLARGRSLHSVCSDPDMPCADTILRWARNDPAFAEHLEAIRGPRSQEPHWSTRPKYSDALARGICAALAEGFSLEEICASPAVPVAPHTVWVWTRKRPAFAAAYAEATRPRPSPRGLVIGRGRPGYTPERAQAIIDRLLEGRALSHIARDPDMPSAQVIKQWRRRRVDFHFAVQAAQRFQLDLLLDEVLAAADAGRRAPGPARRIVAGLARRGVEPFAAGGGNGEVRAEEAEEGAGMGHNWRGR